MRLVIQRVKEASVSVDQVVIGNISRGMLILLGVAKDDMPADAFRLAQKVTELRIFDDAQGKMNCSAQDVGAEFLVVSQFTLYGDCRKGRRPSFDQAADPVKGEALYLEFINTLKSTGVKVATGRFRAMMDVALVNDGPVTFVIDS